MSGRLRAGDPLHGLVHMLSFSFEVRAFVVGGLIAAACGLVGSFVVLRAQVFAADALSHVAFTGALVALASGIDLRLGLFAACVLFAVAMGALGEQGRASDVVIGNVFAWVLGLGVFFLTRVTTGAGGAGGDGTAGVTVLFGSIFGLGHGQAVVAAVVAAAVLLIMVVIARPLLFGSLDPAVAAARGVPVAALGLGFLVIVGVTAGEATQAVGALLLLGLLATPAATAQRLTADPYRALWLSSGLAVAAMWGGLVGRLRRSAPAAVVRRHRARHPRVPGQPARPRRLAERDERARRGRGRGAVPMTERARIDAMVTPPTRPTPRVRHTRQGAAVEQVLKDADGFRTAKELYDEVRAQGHDIGLATVYRHVNALADDGTLDVVHRGEGEAQYRLCGPGTPGTQATDDVAHHHHVVCRSCGRSVEVAAPEVEEWAERVAAGAGYTDVTHTLEVFGLCPEHAGAVSS